MSPSSLLVTAVLSCLFTLLVTTPAQADTPTTQPSSTSNQAQPGAIPLKDLRAVVVDKAALPVTNMAAKELADYIGRIRNQPLAIIEPAAYKPDLHAPALFVGADAVKACLGTELPAFGREEYMLQTVPQGLILAGADGPGNPWSLNTAAGTALAAYTLLDDILGVKWVWPGEIGEEVPLNPEALIPPQNTRTQPRFIIRSYGVGYSTYHSKNFRDDVRQWARRTRQGWVPRAAFGHSWFDTFDLRNGSVFKEHPEWFALVNGKRRPPQMCTTHPDVIRRVVDSAINAKLDIANISPSDGGGFCQCNETNKSEAHKKANAPSCTSLDIPGRLAYDGKSPELSDRIFTYANQVAREVAQRDPGKSVGMFAYTFYNKPPVHIQKLEPNLYLSFVSQAMALRDPLAQEDWKQIIAGWHTKDARMILREGWGNHYLLDLPFMHYKQILSCISDAQRMGFIASYGEGTKAFSTQGPNTWAVVRMLWDPTQDTSKVMDGYYKAAFGPAAQEMQAYYAHIQDTLDRNWEKRKFILDSRNVAYVNLINSWSIILPLEEVDKAAQFLKQAQAKAPAGSLYAKRIDLCSQGHQYTRTLLEAISLYQQISESGVKMEFFSAALPDGFTPKPLDKAVLQRAYELGQERERLLLLNRDLPFLDEGLLGYANDNKLRMWHENVKRQLGTTQPTQITMEVLSPEMAARRKAPPATTKPK